MSSPLQIVDAQANHAEKIAAIYNHALTARTATFETTPRTSSDVLQWIDQNNLFKVALLEVEVVGFARTSPYRDRDCYRGVKEYSVYVNANHHGQNIGETVLNALITDCRTNGTWKLLSRIFPENVASIKLAQKCGFEIVGTYKKHGQLDGQWKDCTIVELCL